MNFFDWWAEQSQWNKYGMVFVAAVVLILIVLLVT